MDKDKIYKGIKIAASLIATTIISTIIGNAINFLQEDASRIVYTVVIDVLALLCCAICVKLYYLNKELKDVNNSLHESNKVSSEFGVGKGDAYLLMSLTQNLNEPLKIKYLEKAKEEGSELASLILANLYSSGIEKDKKIVLEQNREQAADIYLYMIKKGLDNHGVANWQMGYYYENDLIKAARRLTDNNARYKKAVKYYNESDKKGFGKANNSLAIYYRKGLGGVKENLMEAEKNYMKACDYGDVYAFVNYGHLSLQQYEGAKILDIRLLTSAEESFKVASEYDNNEAYYQLGQVYSIRAKMETNKSDYIRDAAYSYIQAFSKVNNMYSASAYYQLGKLITFSRSLGDDAADLTKDSKVTDALKNPKFEDLAIECLMRAYDQFEKIDKSRLGYKYGLVYDELKESISKCL